MSDWSGQRRRLTSGEPGQALRAARRAAGVMLLLVAFMWLVEAVDAARGHLLDTYGITPRDPDELPDILTAPFLHTSANHLAANTMPLFVLGFLTALRGIGRFVLISAVIVVTSGLGVWLVGAPRTIHLGASGLVFGYFGYLVARGLLDRRLRDLLIAVLVALVYGVAILAGALPGQEGISWEAHFFGLVGGAIAAYLLRRGRSGQQPA